MTTTDPPPRVSGVGSFSAAALEDHDAIAELADRRAAAEAAGVAVRERIASLVDEDSFGEEAAAYIRRSSHSSARIVSERFIAPTVTIDSGQTSRISRTNGQRRIQRQRTPAQPQKNCGDVATTTSTRRSQRACHVAVTRKLRKLRIRPRKPLFAARSVQTRITRITRIYRRTDADYADHADKLMVHIVLSGLSA